MPNAAAKDPVPSTPKQHPHPPLLVRYSELKEVQQPLGHYRFFHTRPDVHLPGIERLDDVHKIGSRCTSRSKQEDGEQ